VTAIGINAELEGRLSMYRRRDEERKLRRVECREQWVLLRLLRTLAAVLAVGSMILAGFEFGQGDFGVARVLFFVMVVFAVGAVACAVVKRRRFG